MDGGIGASSYIFGSYLNNRLSAPSGHGDWPNTQIVWSNSGIKTIHALSGHQCFRYLFKIRGLHWKQPKNNTYRHNIYMDIIDTERPIRTKTSLSVTVGSLTVTHSPPSPFYILEGKYCVFPAKDKLTGGICLPCLINTGLFHFHFAKLIIWLVECQEKLNQKLM